MKLAILSGGLGTRLGRNYDSSETISGNLRTPDNLAIINKIETNYKIFQYENAQRILSQDIFQGKKFYYDFD